MAPRLERRAAARAPLPMPIMEESEGAEATLELARAMTRLAKSIDKATETIAPAAEVLGGMGHRLDAFCLFFKKWWPRLLWSAPGVIVAIGAVSPNAAALLKAVLEALRAGAAG